MLVGCSSQKTRDAIDQVRDQPLDPDIEALKKTDPKLILFKEVGRIPTGFDEPRGIAVSERGIYVAGDKAVALFTPGGKRIGQTNLPAEPQCLAVDPTGKVYTAANDRVMVVNGPAVEPWAGLGPKALITSIALNGDGVWVADAGNRLVDRYDATGRLIGSFGKRDPATKYPGLIVPSPHLDLAGAPDGNLLVTNPGTHRVEKHATSGKLISFWGRESPDIDGFCGCCNPTDIAVLADGSVITSEKGLPRIKLYDAKGKFVGVVAGADSFNENVKGIDLATFEGRVYALDPFNKVVRVYASKSVAKP